MKRRGLRATLTAGAIGLAVVAVVVAFNWGVVRDHAEAWWLQATTKTETILPDPAYLERCKTGDGYQFSGARELLGFFASSTGRPVIASHDELESEKFSAEVRGDLMTTEMMWALLRVYSGSGRIVEQRFLRQAYVVVGYPPLGSKIRMRVPIR